MVDRSDNTFEGNEPRKATGTGNVEGNASQPAERDTEHVDGRDAGTSGASRPRGKTEDPDKTL